MLQSYSVESVIAEFTRKASFLETLERLITTGKISSELLSSSSHDYFSQAFNGFTMTTNVAVADKFIIWIDRYARGSDVERKLLLDEIYETENQALSHLWRHTRHKW